MRATLIFAPTTLPLTVQQGRRERGGYEGGTRALALALGRFRNKHGQAGVSDLDLGGRRAAVIGGLGFGAVVRAWALLLLLVQVLAQVLVPQVPRYLASHLFIP